MAPASCSSCFAFFATLRALWSKRPPRPPLRVLRASRSSLRFVPSWSKRHAPRATCPWSKRPPRLPARPRSKRHTRPPLRVLRASRSSLRFVPSWSKRRPRHARHPAPPWPKRRPRRPPQGAGTAVPAPQGRPPPASSRWYAFQPGHQPVCQRHRRANSVLGCASARFRIGQSAHLDPAIWSSLPPAKRPCQNGPAHLQGSTASGPPQRARHIRRPRAACATRKPRTRSCFKARAFKAKSAVSWQSTMV